MIRDLDQNGNVKAGTFVYKDAAISVDIECKLQLFKRENPFNYSDGVDWINEMHMRDFSKLRAIIEDLILDVYGVTSIYQRVSFSFDRINRSLKVFGAVNTIYNEKLKIEVFI